jgi:hypothetical protein
MMQEGKARPADDLAGMAAIFDEEDIEPGALDRQYGVHFGVLQVLAGDHDSGIGTLEPWVDVEVAPQGFDIEIEARHALAWAWQQVGMQQRANAMLRLLDLSFGQQQADGQLHMSHDIFAYARNALLLGKLPRALDLLEQAEAAGWRGYYTVRQDPRWDALRDKPRFRAIMARVQADLDRQRARMEQIDAEEDFSARLNAVLAVKAAEAPSR